MNLSMQDGKNLKQLAEQFHANSSSLLAAVVIGLTIVSVLGCSTSDQATRTVEPDKPHMDESDPLKLAGTNNTDLQPTAESELDNSLEVDCPAVSGPAVAVNRWEPNWGNGLNEIWVIPIAEADLVLKDSQGNPITLAPGTDPNADTQVEVKTYEVGPAMGTTWDAHHACNLTQTDLANEYVLGAHPEGTELLIYRTNEIWCEKFIGYELPIVAPGNRPLPTPPQSKADCEPLFWQIVLTDISTGDTRVVADFGKQVSIEKSGGGILAVPAFSADVFQASFSPDGSKLSYIEPCWQGTRYQEAIGATRLLKKRCQDGGYLVVVDLESLNSHIVHGSENDAAIISGYAWSPDGSSILIRQECSEKAGMFLPEDTTRDELAACNGIWTIAASLQSDHFEPEQTLPIDRFFDCDDWYGPIIREAIWSPTGDAITVAVRQNVGCMPGIWEIEVDSGEFENLVDCPYDSEKLNEPVSCGDVKWSPTGDQFLFYADSDGAGDPEVWVSDRVGAEPRHISPWHPAPEGSVEWSPDGRQIAFHTYWNSKPSLLMVEVDDPNKIVTVPLSGAGVRRYGFAWLGW